MGEFVKTVDLKSLWKNQPVKEGNATNEVFFKWLGFNIFGKRFKEEKYLELYKKYLWRTFCGKVTWSYATYEELNESEEDMLENVAKMTEWLKSLKDYECPRFYTFNNDVEKINTKYYVEARIGYDNSKSVCIFSDKPFKSFTPYYI